MKERWFGWHFLTDEGLMYRGLRKPQPGRIMRASGELLLCSNGMHACKDPLQALREGHEI